ncbi:MAG TPA: alpha/beta hydrolase [Pseudonocardiaceae bacterium]
MSIRESFVDTSRLRTHVLESGSPDAPTLVLVHGNVSSARFFAQTLAVLGERFHCVAPDMRGFGGSARLPVDARRGLSDFTDDLHAVLTELVPDRRVHLLGWSLGGGIVLRYAMDHPDAVASIVLESPMSPFGFGGTKDLAGNPCWPDYAGSGGGTANPELVRRIVAGDRSADDNTSPRRVLTTLYGNPPFELAREFEDALVEEILALAIGDDNYPGDSVPSPSWPGSAPGERGVNNAISPKYCDLSAFADMPSHPDVLWIRGDADQIVSDTALVDLGYLGQLGLVPDWPGAATFPAQPMVSQMRAVLDRHQAGGGRYTEHVLPGCGHSPHLERPAEFTGLVTAFLRSSADLAS